ncbi:MAG TPA: hypothetical protein VF322_07210 [Gammaproteobacteria bacterium]
MATSIPDLRAVCVVVTVLALAMCAGEPTGTPPARTGGDDGERAISAAPPVDSRASSPAQRSTADAFPAAGGAEGLSAWPGDCPGVPAAAGSTAGAAPPAAAFRCAVRLPDGRYHLKLGSAGTDTTSLAIEIEGGTLVLELAPREAEALIATNAASP